MMTERLEKVFKEAAKLPEDEQDALAALIVEEMLSEASWDEAFLDSQDALSKLADEALDELRCGKTQPLDLDIPL